MTDHQPDAEFAATVSTIAPWAIAVGIAWAFAGAWVGRENARTEAEKARQSVECAKNPVAIWKDDRCQRIPE